MFTVSYLFIYLVTYLFILGLVGSSSLGQDLSGHAAESGDLVGEGDSEVP